MTQPQAFARSHHERLVRALGTAFRERAPLSYPQVAGFIYPVVAAPHAIVPSQWWHLVLGDEPSAVGDDIEGFVEALMALNNFAAQQVLAESPRFPPGCEPPTTADQAFGPDAAFGQWAAGFMAGHTWLEREWKPVLAEGQRGDIDTALTMLAIFPDRPSAAAIVADAEPREDGSRPTVEQVAREVLPEVAKALALYMRVAREVRMTLVATGEYDEPPEGAGDPTNRPHRRATPRTGRNAPCPCGSGRKYKHCCGSRMH